MIITMTDIRAMALPEISTQEAPSNTCLELVTDKSNTGMITGNPRMAIIVDGFPVLEESDDIMVNPTAIPVEPINRFTKNNETFSTGKPKNTQNKITLSNTRKYW